MRIGFAVGWLAVLVAVAGLAVGGEEHAGLVIALTASAAAANAAAMLVPWQTWLEARRGRLLLDLWSGALIGLVAVLVYGGGANFTLLLFLAAPFIAVVQRGWRRVLWLGAIAATCALAAALLSFPAEATAIRLTLVAAAVALVLLLARAIRAEAARARFERALSTEANHRIKNNLQAVADLLLLGRPAQGDARPFEDAATRIRSIATVHRLLTETREFVSADELLHDVATSAPVPVAVDAEPVPLDPSTAQRLGIVVNELVTNAFRHGAPPIAVRLVGGREIRLQVDDAGRGVQGPQGLGLRLVSRVVEEGLGGRLELAPRPGGGTRAVVVFGGEV